MGSEFNCRVEPIYQEIGLLLMVHRHEQGLTQEQVADLLGLSRTSIVNIESGRQRIMLHTIIAIAALLDLSPGELIDKAIGRLKP